MGLLINEEWRIGNDDSYFKLVRQEQEKELKPGQIMKGLKHVDSKAGEGGSWGRPCLEMTKSVFGPDWGVSHRRSHQNDSKQLMLMSGAQKVQSDHQP